jgi:hypothetical protein
MTGLTAKLFFIKTTSLKLFKIISNMLKKLYKTILPGYLEYLQKELTDTNSILDLGCGRNSPLGALKLKAYKVGVDNFTPALLESRKKKIHDRSVKSPLLKILEKIPPHSFETVVLLDVIEHFTKDEGSALLQIAESLATKKVVVFTPNGFLAQGKLLKNPYQVHRSGWTVEELKTLGYRLQGINGLKILRGEEAQMKCAPQKLWEFISDLTQKITYHFPAWAFQLLAVKDMRKSATVANNTNLVRKLPANPKDLRAKRRPSSSPKNNKVLKSVRPNGDGDGKIK